MRDERERTVITMPPPTANGGLHIGHLSGPYLAADIAARAARAAGDPVLLHTGIDIHQNYVPVRAQQESRDVEEMLQGHRDEIVAALDRAGVSYDAFTDTREPAHAKRIDALLGALVDAGRLPVRDVILHECRRCARTLHHVYVTGRCAACGGEAGGGACEGCGGFTCAATLIDPVCARCGEAASRFAAAVPVLPLEDHRETLARLLRRAELPAAVRQLVDRHFAGELPEVPVAYPTDWGIEGTGPLVGLRVDAFVEMAFTDLTGIARAIDPQADRPEEYAAAWHRVGRLWHFLGLDNAFYYALLWPALFAAAGVESPLAGLAVNEFYTLAGKKVSTSRDHVVWASDLLATEDPAIVRLYLAWDSPDRYPSDFTWRAFSAFRDHAAELLARQRGPGALPVALHDAERERGTRALTLPGFDPPLAVRSLLSLLAAGADPEPLRSCLTGAPPVAE